MNVLLSSTSSLGERVGVVDPDRLRVDRAVPAERCARSPRRSPASSCRGNCWCPPTVAMTSIPTGSSRPGGSADAGAKNSMVLSLVRWTPTCVPAMMPKRYSRPICAPASVPKQSDSRSPKSPCAERPGEAVRHPERAAEPRHPQRGRQRDQREVRLRRIDRAVVDRLVGLIRPPCATPRARARLRSGSASAAAWMRAGAQRARASS